jgi:predicted DNA-binding transcriptional regulator YafY
MLFGIDIIKDKQTKKFRFDFKNSELTELPGLWFKKSELEALICLQHAMSGLQREYLNEILEPFRTRFEPLLKAQGIDITAWQERYKIVSIFSRDITTSTFETIADAVLHSIKVQIQYRKLGGSTVNERIISPQTLVHYRDNWYVDAWCHLRNDLRTFSLNRILSAKKLNEPAQTIPRKELDAHYTQSFGIFSGKPENIAEILFTGAAAYEVSQERWHHNQTGIWLEENNAYLLKIPYGNTTELVMDILKWGDSAEVVAPKSLREEIRGIIERMRRKYESGK